MLQITKITIKNFRSIENITFDCSNITTFVGLNDAGKSNILRALNLFFNGETDHSLKFDFGRDYNLHAQPIVKKAKEIIVELVIKLPDSYVRKEYPENIVWRKVWRANGEHFEGSYYRYLNKQKFPSRSRIPTLLEKVVYNYVPAIKDKSFFADLQGKVYDVLQTVADKKLRESAGSFEKEIQGHLKDLLSSVSGVFNSQNDMRMPENLRQIFENLEFNSDGIPLSRRGDGIKVRHIPMILRFIAEKRNSILNQGVSHHIWGFEEPENNVEMVASFDLAQQFLEASEDAYQIFLTTHSPVFYGLSDLNPKTVKAYQVIKDGGNSKPQEVNKQQVDIEMGLMQIVTPYINQELKVWLDKKKELDSEISRIKNESAANRKIPHVFVEGSSDEIVLKKAIGIFYKNLVGKVKICSGGVHFYGSANAAKNRAIAWQLIQQHNKTPVKACLILDNDDAGNAAKDEFNKAVGVGSCTKHIKAFSLRDSKKPMGLDEGFKLPVDLEYLYTDQFWKMAEKKDWLQENTDLINMMTQEKREDILKRYLIGKQTDSSELARTDCNLRIRKRFSDESKLKAAKYIESLDDDLAKQYLVNFQSILKEVSDYLELN
jgi:predicted ATP-dependent endonuclease of OLD family